MVEGVILHTEMEGIPTVFVHPIGMGSVISVQVSADEAACIAFELAHGDLNEKERAAMRPDSGYPLLVQDFSYQLVRQLGGRVEQITLQQGFLGDTATVKLGGSKGAGCATCSAGLGMLLGLRFQAPLFVWEDMVPPPPALASFLDKFPGDVAGGMLARIDAVRKRNATRVVRISLVATKVEPQSKAGSQNTAGNAAQQNPVGTEQQTEAERKKIDEERWLSMLNTLPAGNKEPL